LSFQEVNHLAQRKAISMMATGANGTFIIQATMPIVGTMTAAPHAHLYHFQCRALKSSQRSQISFMAPTRYGFASALE
jgi:hypothetical protein